MVLTIVGVAFVGIVVTLTLKSIKPELSVYVSLATGLIIFFLIVSVASNLISRLVSYVSELKLDSEIIIFLLKIVGIGYIIEFMVDVAVDSGCTSIANKIGLAGKIIIASMSLPIIKELIETIMELL